MVTPSRSIKYHSDNACMTAIYFEVREFVKNWTRARSSRDKQIISGQIRRS